MIEFGVAGSFVGDKCGLDIVNGACCGSLMSKCSTCHDVLRAMQLSLLQLRPQLHGDVVFADHVLSVACATSVALLYALP